MYCKSLSTVGCPRVQHICMFLACLQGPYRHYILNVLWILINLLCVVLTIYHLHKGIQHTPQKQFQLIS